MTLIEKYEKKKKRHITQEGNKKQNKTQIKGTCMRHVNRVSYAPKVGDISVISKEGNKLVASKKSAERRNDEYRTR